MGPQGPGVPAPATLPALRAQGEFWHGLWKLPAPGTGLRQWGDALDEPPRMGEPPPMTVPLLRAALRRGERKAPGADGWQVQHLLRLLDQTLQALVLLCGAVGSTGEWPRVLARNVVCLLPKGGSPVPDDRRPIVPIGGGRTCAGVGCSAMAARLRRISRQHCRRSSGLVQVL